MGVVEHHGLVGVGDHQGLVVVGEHQRIVGVGKRQRLVGVGEDVEVVVVGEGGGRLTLWRRAQVFRQEGRMHLRKYAALKKIRNDHFYMLAIL